MSPDTLRFFQELLSQVNIPAAADNFDELVARVSKVRRELADALDEVSEETLVG